MRKRISFILIGAMALTLVGCKGKSDSSDNPTADSKSEVSGVTAETDADGFMETDYGNVKLGNYEGLSGTQSIVTVTDEDIDGEVEAMLDESNEAESLDGPSGDDCVVYVNITATCDGEVVLDYSEDTYDIWLGIAEFGDELDKALTGVYVGDHIDKTIQFDDDYTNDYLDVELAGKTVDFSIDVAEITKEQDVELSDEAAVAAGYDSLDAMRQEAKDTLTESKKDEAVTEAKEALLMQVIDSSTFSGYSEEFYNACKDSVVESYNYYMEMFGLESLEDLDITDADIDEETKNYIYRYITIEAVASLTGLTVSDDEYSNELAEYIEGFGYESEDDFFQDYTKEDIISWMLEEKVLDYLYDNATITEVEPEADDNEEDELEIEDEIEIDADDIDDEIVIE